MIALNYFWLIGDVLLIAVVAPAVVFFLNKVYRPVVEIRHYAHDILEHGVLLTGTLDSVPKLAQTKQLTGTAREVVKRYASALNRLV